MSEFRSYPLTGSSEEGDLYDWLLQDEDAQERAEYDRELRRYEGRPPLTGPYTEDR